MVFPVLVATLFAALPPAARAANADTLAPAQATARQQQWLSATIQQRVQLAEQIGEKGAQTFAKSKGYTPLLNSADKAIHQGFDQVYRASNGGVVVIEAKGGTSPLVRAYGCEQGTAEWAVQAAQRMLKSHRVTTAERQAAQVVLEAAEQNRLVVQVVRTKHVLGEPVVAVLEQTSVAGAKESSLATKVLADVRGAATARTVAAATERELVSGALTGSPAVGKTAAASKLATAAKVVGEVAFVADAGLRGYQSYGTEQRYRAGKISQKERVTFHARNAAGMAGGWTGAWAGAEMGVMAGGTVGTLFGGVGAPIGAFVGGSIGAVGGYLGGEYIGEQAAETAVQAAYAK
jgi:hypothetical protein